MFTRLVSEIRGKPKLVVNIEISKNGDFCKRKLRGDVLHLESQIVEESYIVRGIRGEINSTEKFG